MTNSPLATLLDAYVEASVNHYLASKGLFHGTLAKRDVHAVRAAILAEFATVEVERGYWHEEARRYAQNVDFWRDKAEAALRAAQREEYIVDRERTNSSQERTMLDLIGPPFPYTKGDRVRVTKVEKAP